jgi:phage terminase large subunit
MLDGDWDVFAGQYFTEFRREIHTVEPFPIPPDWRRYIALDYGLDMLAAYWIAVDWHQKAYVYKELYQSDLIISEAAKRIKEMTGKEQIYQRLAPPDLWNRRQETGKSAADLFRENGVSLVKANNNRIQGWYNLKEWLKPYDDEQGIKTASLVIFKNCVNLIRTLPLLQRDEKDPNDVANEPHELTHGPDAIRYFIAGRPRPTEKPYVPDPDNPTYDELMQRQLGDVMGGDLKVNL